MAEVNEFEQYITANDKLSKLSKRTYQSSYNKLRQGVDELRKVDEQTIIDYLDIVNNIGEINNATYVNVLNVAIQVRNHFEKSTDQLFKKKVVLSQMVKNERLAKKTVYAEMTEDEKTHSVTDLRNYLNMLFAEEKWREYIINYLLIHFHCRNKDVNLTITNSITQARSDNNKNYLVVVPSYITYIRNDFKTCGKYGRQTARIAVSKFLFAVNAFVEQSGGLETGDLFLLSTGQNRQINYDSIQKYIAGKTLDNLGQSIYNKIITTDAVRRKDLKSLRTISSRRGTSLEVLLDFYDLNI